MNKIFAIAFLAAFQLSSCSLYSSDSLDIVKLFNRGYAIEYTDRDSALLLFNLALDESISLDNPSLIAKSYRLLGNFLLNEGKTDSSLFLLNKAKTLYHSARDSSGLLSIYYTLGTYYSITGDYQTAIKNSYKSLAYANALKNTELEIYILESIGVTLGRYKDHEEEVSIYLKALEKAEAINDTYSIANIKYNLSTALNTLGKVDLAKKYLEDAELQSLKHGFSHIYGLSVNALAEYYYNLKDFENSKRYIDKLDSILIDHEFNDLKMRGEFMKSTYYNSKSEYSKSLEHGKRALQLLSYFRETDYELRTYKSLSETYKGLGQYSQAFVFLEKHNVLKDSILFNNRHQELKAVQIQYETAQKDVEIKQQQIIIQNQKHRRQATLGGISLLSIFGVGMFLFQSQRLKNNKIIAETEAAIQSHQISQLEKENKILSMSSMIEGQESERKRIAQDLHDGLGGLLATIKVKFGIIQREIEDLESMNVYQQTSNMIDDACTEVRKIAHNMMPDSLTKLGLIEAIRDISDYTSDLNIDVINLGIHQFTKTQEIMIYRVIQEFINNSRKHGKASKVIVQFSADEHHSYIYLEDNGNGFNLEDVSQKRGLGLESMKSRVNFIGGIFELDSTLGVGTTVQIKLPKE